MACADSPRSSSPASSRPSSAASGWWTAAAASRPNAPIRATSTRDGPLAAWQTWHGHYWVVDGEWSVIADVTGDQFGWEPVLVADTEDPRFRANYREAAIEEHLEHVAGRIEGWLEEWAAERRAAFAPP